MRAWGWQKVNNGHTGETLLLTDLGMPLAGRLEAV
jgi:hypothetical protein